MTEYKGYIVEGDGTFGMKIIKPVGRGTVPNELRGAFSSFSFAQRAIDLIADKKEKHNGEVVSGN
jgi:hypothetical protein